MDATEVLPELQEPPEVASVHVIDDPTHTAAGPPMAAGIGFTVTDVVA